MTRRLEQAFRKAATLPDHLQDALADQMVEDVEGENAWDATLTSPRSQDALDQMAEAALKAHRAKKTHPAGFGEL